MTHPADSPAAETAGVAVRATRGAGCGAGCGLPEIAVALGARVVTHPERAVTVRVTCYAAASHVSDLLAQASPTTLLVSALDSPHLVRIAELLDVPAVCVVGDGEPAAALVAAAAESGKVLLAATVDDGEVRRRLVALGVGPAVGEAA